MAAQPRIQSHMNTNRLADPENLYIPGFEGVLKKKVEKKINRHFEYWWRSNNYFSSYRVNKEFIN